MIALSPGIALDMPPGYEESCALVRDLLDSYILALEDSRRTILDIPELVAVAGDGVEQIDRQLALARRTRAFLDA